MSRAGKDQSSNGQAAAGGGTEVLLPASGAAQAAPEDGLPPAPSAPLPSNAHKKRVKCEALKGKKIIIGKGEAVQIDANGFFEADAKEAERLLTIPGYEEA